MPIKIFTSAQAGAPTLVGNAAGSLITALDAILVNGYNTVNTTSITRTGQVATLTASAAHGFATGDVALIASATQTEYNGEFVVTVTSPTVFTYTVTGTPATPATTGTTITSKRASGGFAKPFSGTNKAVYRANDVTGLRNYYRVIDDGATAGGNREARFVGYVSMTDVDTGADIHPTAAQYPNGFYWQKSSTADAVGRAWVCVTDGKTVYWFGYLATLAAAEPTTSNTSAFGIGFGDTVPFKTGDIYSGFTAGTAGESQFGANIMYNGLANTATSFSVSTPAATVAVFTFSRDFTGVSGAKTAQIMGSGFSGTLGGTVTITYPHSLDNGFYMTPAILIQASPALIRARLPGMFESLHGQCFPQATVIDNVQGYSGRKFIMLGLKAANTTGCAVIDITGPWDS